MKSLFVVLPARNEAKSIGSVIKSVPKIPGFTVSVIVLDGNSTDRTVSISKSLGARVFSQKSRGKGSAFSEFLASLKRFPDVVVMLDADSTYSPKDIPKSLKALSGYDVVVGSRLSSFSPGAFKPLNLVGNHVLTFIANTLYKTKTPDLCSGFWVFNGKALSKFNVTAPHFDLEADLFVNVNKLGLRFTSVPISYVKRVGESKLGLNAAFSILKRLIAR
ncbi:MAG TPA: glycosyltransferase family 2 protein [Candidatus Nanoarchaeia archaeon]|nr:glycosyltransferase family 2 protein [Candidatus Nanoarchaeia archaeon]